MARRRRRPGPPGGDRPPQSERSGRGALIDSFDKDYQRIGRSNRYRNPTRNMTVGVRTRKDFGSDEANFNLKRAASKRLARG